MVKHLAVTFALLFAGLARVSAHAALSAADRCLVEKFHAAGAYAECRLRAEAVGVRGHRPPDFARCDDQFRTAWGKIEAKAGGACPVTGNGTAIQAAIIADTNALDVAISSCPVSVGGACWFVGVAGQSCNQVCAGVGRSYDDATRTFAGSEGTDEHCAGVLVAFGLGPLDQPSQGGCAVGLGCAIADDGTAFRCAAPATTSPSASASPTRRLCACL